MFKDAADSNKFTKNAMSNYITWLL
jgi:hypothetical protein